MKKLQDRLRYVEREITSQKLIDHGYPVFVRNTPIHTGNARRRTTKDNDEIRAEYPYAARLDQGYSRQSPDGMVQPTIKAIREYIRKVIG